MLDGTSYDGKTEIALFPGDLPDDPDSLFEDGTPVALNFLRFPPPQKLDTQRRGRRACCRISASTARSTS